MPTRRLALSPSQEADLGLVIAFEFMDEIRAGRLCPSEIRETLREVVNEIGADHTNKYLVDVATHRVLRELGGRS